MIKILIVDDSLLMRKILKDHLFNEKYEVVGEAVNGNQAIEMYNKFKPDVVTMDITMDEKNGLEAAKEILSINPQANIIMVSALNESNLLKNAFKIGVKDFIVKPFDAERLYSVIEKVVCKS